MLVAPLAHIEAIDRFTLNECLTDWGHRMGPYTRPRFTFEAHHALMVQGKPMAVTAAGETVREVVGDTGLRRQEVVELVRLCAAWPSLTRPMLRLWREIIFRDIAMVHGRWRAVSYQDAVMHTGNLYRFDGWLLIGKGGGGGDDARSGRQGRDLNIWAWPPKVPA